MTNSIVKAAALMAAIVTTVVLGYEAQLRGKGVAVTYDDGPALWADKRAQTDDSENAIVFAGSSRIKFALDFESWEAQTGTKAIQLSCVGSNPRPILEDLANDPGFHGKLLLDVTEPLFFSDLPPFAETPVSNIKYYHERTLSQRASFELNHILESQLVFLDKENFSLNAQLDHLFIPNRPGVFAMPVFPREFGLTDFDRHTFMTDHFASDTAQVNTVRNIWLGMMKMPMGPPLTDAQIDGIIAAVKTSVDKIRARGGEVVFIRTPSSGPFLQAEQMGFPRARYWDKLLAGTGCRGVHFADYPETAGFQCPEFSHLTLSDSKKYTRQLASILQRMDWIPARKPVLSHLIKQ